MENIRIAAISLGLLLGASLPAAAETMLVKNGRPQATIVALPDAKGYNLTAAARLNSMLRSIAGDTLAVADKMPRRGTAVVIGEPARRASHDGYEITTTPDGSLHIATAGGKGAIYGVNHLLEQMMGVDYLSRDYFTFTPSADVVIPTVDVVETPAFRYRQTQSYSFDDPFYRDWTRTGEPSDVFIDGMWVHTMNRILPSDRFGESHPEYYSFINGERRPGHHSQWCLTSDAVFEACCEQLDSIFAANPEKTLISVSQNDGNDTNCHCEECTRLEQYEGSPSGPIIHFMNKLASRYPDKEFSTLAYLFSMQPPRHVKPLPNVNIMLCDIDCMREVPLTDNASGRDFVRAIDGWSRISNNIFVWDYGINFDNIVSPFPNFHVMQPNVKLFRDHHANMIFEQVHGGEGCDLTELRSYLMAKLMWNPDIDYDSTMHHFVDRYYGAAAPYVYDYIKMREGALLSSGTNLWIYDSPVTHKNGMLNPACRRAYNALFDKAEQAVAADSARLAHVRMARLPLMYADLEIARATGTGDPDDLRRQVADFRRYTEAYGVGSLTERRNPPADYCDIYLNRYMPSDKPNKARGAIVTYAIEPKPGYMPIADKALTDGLYGGTTFVESWVGWEGTDADFTLDLGELTDISEITTDFLHQSGAWILEPRRVTWSVAATPDGEWTPFGSHEFAEDRDMAVKFNTVGATSAEPVQARYIRVQVDGLGLCPSWHFGVGHPVWFFIDEVTAR